MMALLQFVPVGILLYFAAIKQDNFLAAKWTFISALIVYTIVFIQQKFKLDKKQWVLMLITLLLSGVTYVFHDDRFIRLKGPVVFTLQGLAFLLSPYVHKTGKTLAEMLLHEAFAMPMAVWKRVNTAFALFSFFLAGINYWVAFTWPQYWAQFKIFGSMGLMILFFVVLFWLCRTYMRDADTGASQTK